MQHFYLALDSFFPETNLKYRSNCLQHKYRIFRRLSTPFKEKINVFSFLYNSKMAENILFRFKQKQNPPPKPKNVKQMLFSMGFSFKKKITVSILLETQPLLRLEEKWKESKRP